MFLFTGSIFNTFNVVSAFLMVSQNTCLIEKLFRLKSNIDKTITGLVKSSKFKTVWYMDSSKELNWNSVLLY